MTGSTTETWLETRSIDWVTATFRSLGCDHIVVKHLAPNDNTKNQIYVGPDLSSVARIPSGQVEHRPAHSKKAGAGAPIYRVPVPFSWIAPEGPVPAPDAKLIFYPQYPEVRLSGLLRGCAAGPNSLLDPTRRGREAGRWLLLGVSTGSEQVFGLLLPSSAPASGALEAAQFTAYGALSIWELATPDATAPPREALLSALCAVHDKAWIPGKKLTANGPVAYAAQNAGGFTLEAELGITPNGIAAPDYLGWEVKQHDVGRLDHIRHNAVTLLTPEPDGGVYVEQGVVDFVTRWGHPHSSKPARMDFSGIHRCGQLQTGTGLRLVLEPDAIALVDTSDTVAASWSHTKILDHWKKKHSAAVFVPSEKRKTEDPAGNPLIEYRYGDRVTLGEGTTFQHLLDAIASELVYYDPGIHIDRRSNGTWKSKKRNQFRINSRYVGELYEESTIVPTCSAA